ncbi:glycoside hydrolase family 3 N-terminal domain-containing protein [Corynebacterium pygosceleis]|nr:glycoside hydrolase family 3 N-terminal domain-containing protein [Corynebacterium pygosceleis]
MLCDALSVRRARGRTALVVGAVVLGLSACAPAPEPTPSPDPRYHVETGEFHGPPLPPMVPPPPPLPEPDPIADPVAAARANLPDTQRGLVASLMTVGVRDYDDALFALRQGAGGIFIGSWTDPSLLTGTHRNIAVLREAVGRPFAVTIDAEGGRVVRQPDIFGHLPAPRTMAETMTPEQVRALASELGTKLAGTGVTVDFAPVLDTTGEPATAAIGDRSFSPDPERAALYASAFAAGLRDAGITPVFKHFPGHGRATGDSHYDQVLTPDLGQLRELDLKPYGPALESAPGAVMVGHMIVPGLGAEGLPATLNPAVYDLLRRGDYPGGRPFDGVIYTDDLSGMKAVSTRLDAPQAVLASLRAGADVALWISTDDLVAAVDTVDRAVTEGEFPVEQLEASALRVQLQNLGPLPG